MGRNIAVSTAKILTFFVLASTLIAGFFVYGGPLLGFDISAMREGPKGMPGVIMETGQLVMTFLAAAAMMLIADRKSPMSMGLSPKSLVPHLMFGTVIGAGIFVFALAIAVSQGWASFNPSSLTAPMAVIGTSFAIMMLHAAFEEVMIRGYVLQTLMSKFSVAASVVASSLLFVALHGPALFQDQMGAVGAVNIFVASVLMSIAYLRTGALWLAIGLHGGWNFVQGPILGIAVSGNDLGTGQTAVTFHGPDWATGGSFGYEAALPALAGPLLGILIVWALFRRPASEPAAEPDKSSESEVAEPAAT